MYRRYMAEIISFILTYVFLQGASWRFLIPRSVYKGGGNGYLYDDFFIWALWSFVLTITLFGVMEFAKILIKKYNYKNR